MYPLIAPEVFLVLFVSCAVIGLAALVHLLVHRHSPAGPNGVERVILIVLLLPIFGVFSVAAAAYYWVVYARTGAQRPANPDL